MHWNLPSQLHSGPESRRWSWLLQLFPRLQRKPKRQSKTLELIPSLLQRFFRNHHFQVFHFCITNLHSIYLGQRLIFGLRFFFGLRWRVILDLEGCSVNWIFSTCFGMLLKNPVLTFGIWSWTVIDLSFSFLNFIVFESTSVHDCQFRHCFLTRSFFVTECKIEADVLKMLLKRISVIFTKQDLDVVVFFAILRKNRYSLLGNM